MENIFLQWIRYIFFAVYQIEMTCERKEPNEPASKIRLKRESVVISEWSKFRARDASERARNALWAKIAKKVHKPPLRVNIIYFELDGFNMHPSGPLEYPRSQKDIAH